MQEENYMVCVRVQDLETPVEGSTTTACVDCGCDIWISQESRKQLGQIGAMPLCEPCAKRMAEELPHDQVSIGSLTPGQASEIAIHLRNRGWPELFGEDDLDLFEAMKQTARKAGEEMTGPDDGWGSLVIMDDYNGMTYPPVPLSKMLREGVPKEVLARQLLPAIMQAANAKRVIFGLAPKADGELSGQGEADLVKALVLIEVTADGVQRVEMADIERDGVSGPRLGDWRVIPVTADFKTGPFVDATVATLQLVRTLRTD